MNQPSHGAVNVWPAGIRVRAWSALITFGPRQAVKLVEISSAVSASVHAVAAGNVRAGLVVAIAMLLQRVIRFCGAASHPPDEQWHNGYQQGDNRGCHCSKAEV